MHHREARDYPTLLLNDVLHVKKEGFFGSVTSVVKALAGR